MYQTDMRFYANEGKCNVICQFCRSTIPKGNLRIQVDKLYRGAWLSYCPECMFKSFSTRSRTIIISVDDIGAFDLLTSGQQNYISQLLKNYLPKCETLV